MRSMIVVVMILTMSLVSQAIEEVNDQVLRQDLATATIERTLTYQGLLKDASGDPVPDASYNITFRLFENAAGGSALWNSGALAVTTADGYFTKELGPIPLNFDRPYYLSMQVSPDAEMTQRQKVTMSPYSAVSDTANYAFASPGGSNWNVSSGVLSTNGYWGLAKGSANNIFYGNLTSSHINFGDSSATGASDQAKLFCLVLGGRRNLARGDYSIVGNGFCNAARGNYSFVGGGRVDSANSDYGIVVGGNRNLVQNSYAVVVGGENNKATNIKSIVVGGENNVSGGTLSFIGGGYQDSAQGMFSVVVGGQDNVAMASHSTAVGGHDNTASENYTFVGGGNGNVASGYYAAIGGGHQNNASGQASTLSGGESNQANGVWSGIGGGYANLAGSTYATDDTGAFVGGGTNNRATAKGSVVVGGSANSSLFEHSFIGGGLANNTWGAFSTVAGGHIDTAVGEYNFIGGGQHNKTTGIWNVIGGGRLNYVGDTCSVVCGGKANQIWSKYSTILGGSEDTVIGSYTLVFGKGIWAISNNTFILYDSENRGNLLINRDNRDGYANGPITVGTNATNGNTAYLSNGGTWTNMSSSTAKENFTPFDGEELLRKISSLSVTTYNYKKSTEKHVGPVAEEFVGAFDVGIIREENGLRDNRALAASDVAGVALAGVQELIKEIRELKDRNETLEARIVELEAAQK